MAKGRLWPLMIDEAHLLCDRLQSLIQDALIIRKSGSIQDKLEQLDQIRNAILVLEQKGLSIPAELTQLYNSLADTENHVTIAGEALLVIRSRMADILAKVDIRPVKTNGRKRRTTSRLPFPENVTPLSAYEQPIIDALRELDGSAPVAVVRQKVFSKMQDQLLPNDFESQATTGEVLWRYRINWAAHHLRDVGKLKRGSSRGTWELADVELLEEHK